MFLYMLLLGKSSGRKLRRASSQGGSRIERVNKGSSYPTGSRNRGGWKLGIEAVRELKDREEEEEEAHCGRKRRKRKMRRCGKLGFPRYEETYAA